MPRTHVPSYRLHKSTGQAVVTLDGRSIYLGKHDTPASHAEYNRLTGIWLANGRHLPAERDGPPQDFAVNELLIRYWRWAQGYYVKDGEPSTELTCIRSAMRHLKATYGDTPAADFGPLCLKTVRQKMVETGLSRGVVNGYVGRLKRVFKWGVSEALVPPSVYQGIACVVGLKRGRCTARENEPVKPVAEAWVRKTMEHLPPTVAAMVEVQMLTGMRSGEMCIMRPMDVDKRGRVWLYTPTTHKTAHHGHRRVVPIGPKAQKVLGPALEQAVKRGGTEAFVFSPAEVQAGRNAEKRRRRATPVQPSQMNRRKRRPKRKPRDRYDAGTYRRAIEYALAAANRAGVSVPHWHPHQLRHTAATHIRQEMGLDAARAVLGHRTLAVTDTYAEIDQALATEVAQRLG